jgi:hypothetical protein
LVDVTTNKGLMSASSLLSPDGRRFASGLAGTMTMDVFLGKPVHAIAILAPGVTPVTNPLAGTPLKVQAAPAAAAGAALPALTAAVKVAATTLVDATVTRSL